MNRSHLFFAVFFAAGAVSFLSFCSSNSTPQLPPPVIADPSFANDIQPIFTSNCTTSACHGSAASAGLTLLQGQSYASLVNVISSQEPPKKRVVPGDATNSYLVIKLEGRQTNGGRMPLGGSALHSNTIQNIKNWIDKGAKNN